MPSQCPGCWWECKLPSQRQRAKGQLTTVWLSPECQHFYASSEPKCLLGDARGHLLEEQIFHESFIFVCLSVCSLCCARAYSCGPSPVAQFLAF